MPKYTIEGQDRQSGLQTKLVLTAPTRAEALEQAREASIVPAVLTSDVPGDEEISVGHLVRLVEEIQAFRKEQHEYMKMQLSLLREMKGDTGTPVLRVIVWMIVIAIGVAVGTSAAIQAALPTPRSTYGR